jgi:hypothetical protein
MAHVVNINPIMYNYKFVVNIPPNHEFDIVELCNCAREYARNGIPAGEPVPTVLDDDASYGTKASIRFVTAAGGSDPLFLIFRSGKSNIQGGVTIDQIIRSCGYLLNIISRYHDRIFPRHKYPAELVKPNVHVDAEWL